MKISFLIGIDFKTLRKILADNKYSLSWKYCIDITLHLLFALINSLVAMFERSIYQKRIEQTKITKAPIFILGHWRSGTTHLQYTLAQDPQIYSPSTYEVLFPQTFLLTKKIGQVLLAPFVPKKRPQDNMEGSLEHPNEDEIALAVLTGFSPYLAWPFPKDEERFLKYLDFEQASHAEKEQWKQSFLWYSKKLTFAHAGKRLLFKSPAHTARMDLIREIFPDAIFIHISRKPEKVFVSSLHLYNTWEKIYAFLQTPPKQNFEQRILELYRELYKAYLNQLPRQKIYKMSYENFVKSPLQHLKDLYNEKLSPASEELIQIWENYLQAQSSYQILTHKKSDFLVDDKVFQLQSIYQKIL